MIIHVIKMIRHKKISSGSTNFVEEITVSENIAYIDLHDVLNKQNIQNTLIL